MSILLYSGLSSLVLGSGQGANSTITLYTQITNYGVISSPAPTATYTGSNNVTIYPAAVSVSSGCNSTIPVCSQFVEFNVTGTVSLTQSLSLSLSLPIDGKKLFDVVALRICLPQSPSAAFYFQVGPKLAQSFISPRNFAVSMYATVGMHAPPTIRYPSEQQLVYLFYLS